MRKHEATRGVEASETSSIRRIGGVVHLEFLAMRKMVKLTLAPLFAVTIAATPLVALAQIPQQPPTPRSPASDSQQQRSRIEQLKAEAEDRIEAELTPEQQRQYRTARRRGAGLVQGLDQVTNLSEEQQTEINEIIRKTSEKILDLAPPAQRQVPRQQQR